MYPNPGGVLDPNEVLGRDELLATIWHTLAGQSILLTAERRVGKTSVLRKLANEKHDDLHVIAIDVEAIGSPEEFVERVADRLSPALRLHDRAKYRFFRLLNEFKGTEIRDLKLPAVQIHWKRLLTALLDDFLEDHPDHRLILCLDEFPWFIDKIERQKSPAVAMEMLDALRALRQENSRIRFILSGSIGIHHGLERLRRAGYTNQPLNDVAIIEVPPLSDGAATRLAGLLLTGAGVDWAPGTDAEIAEHTGGFPFFIHHCALLAKEAGTLVPGQTEGLVTRLFRDPHDRGHLRHFRKRLTDYYGASASLAARILDDLAQSAATRAALLNRLRHDDPQLSEAILHDLLDQLEQDHYLARDATGRYGFRYRIIERWWRFDRELP